MTLRRGGLCASRAGLLILALVVGGCASSSGSKKQADKPRSETPASQAPASKNETPTPVASEGATAKTGPAKVTVGDPDVSPNITRGVVDAALEAVPRAVLRCAQAADTPPIGTLTVSLQVAADGKLIGQQVSDDSIGNVALATCSAEAFSGAAFGATTDSRPAYVKVILNFDRS